MRQFDRKKKEHVEMSCPIDVSVYISHMGNVDLLSSNIVRFQMEVGYREWYFRIFCHMVDTAVINAWLLYQQAYANVEAKKLNPKAFRVGKPMQIRTTICRKRQTTKF
jgi:hypothetical protein